MTIVRRRRGIESAAVVVAVFLVALSQEPAGAEGGAGADVVYRRGTSSQHLVRDYQAARDGDLGATKDHKKVTMQYADGGLVVSIEPGLERYFVRNDEHFADPKAADSAMHSSQFRIEARLEAVDPPEAYGLYWGGSESDIGRMMVDLLQDTKRRKVHDYALFAIEGDRFKVGVARRGHYEEQASGALPVLGAGPHTLTVRRQGGAVECLLDGKLIHAFDAEALPSDGPGSAHGVLMSGAGSVRIESYALQTEGEVASLEAGERALQAASRNGDRSQLDRALSHFGPLAREAGDPRAQLRLAQMYAQGAGVVQDYGQALDWAERAARAGHVPAQIALADLLTRGPKELRDGPKALEWLHKAARPEAAAWRKGAWFRIGLIHADGIGVERDYAEARRWFKRAADSAHPAALYALGVLRFEGRGGQTDPTGGVELLERAAGLGNHRAMLTLGKAYGHEQSPVRDPEKAYMWFLLAADKFPAGSRQLKQIEQAKASLADELSAQQRQRAKKRASRWIDQHR